MFSNSNNGYFPGLRSDGSVESALQATETTYGAAAPTSGDQSIVFALLLNGEFFTPEYIISPAESNESVKPLFSGKGQLLNLTQTNYSYALLQFAGPNDVGRRAEWKDNFPANVPHVSGRSKSIDHSLATTSLNSDNESADSSDWEGNIAWGDNHQTYERSGFLAAESVQINGITNDELDDLFTDAPVGRMPKGGNAKMAYRD